jgi:hypothetical protein
VHSSGSYRQPPPEDEHEGLRRFARSIAGDPVFLNKSQQRIAIDSIVEKLDRMEIPIAVGACVWVNPKLESTIQRQIEESPE